MFAKGRRCLFEDFLTYLRGAFNSMLMKSEISVKAITVLLPIILKHVNAPAMMHHAMLLMLRKFIYPGELLGQI